MKKCFLMAALVAVFFISGCGNTQFAEFDSHSFGCIKGDIHGTVTNSNASGSHLRMPEDYDLSSMTPDQIKALVEVLCL